jgi:hypothetical protein
LVNEAYLQLAEYARLEWQSRSQFIGVAARVMRRVLREHARRRAADRRRPGTGQLLLEDTMGFPGRQPLDVLDLERAMDKLAEVDPELTRVVELRSLAG